MNLYPATEDHLEEIMEIDKEAFPTPWSRKLWIKEISRTHRAYHVAIENKKVIGFGGGLLAGDDFHITTIAVRASNLSKGVATRIMIKLLDEALKLGATNLTLEVRAGNHPAQALYRRFGMAPVGIRPSYYQPDHEDALIMWANDIHEQPYLELLDSIKQGQKAKEVLSS